MRSFGVVFLPVILLTVIPEHVRGLQVSHFTTTDSVRIAYRIDGAGTPVVIVHGGPGLGMGSLRGDLAPLTASARLIFYDQRGAGHSGAGDTLQATIDRHLADLDELIANVGYDRVALVGHSWGAGLAALYAGLHPDRVRALVMLAPIFARAQPWAGQAAERGRQRADTLRDRRVATLSGAMRTAPDPLAICRELQPLILERMLAPSAVISRADLCDLDPANITLRDAVARNTFRTVGAWDWRERAGRYPGPVLVVHGEADTTPLGSAEEWAALFARGRLLVVPGAGHLPHVSDSSGVFAEIRRVLNDEEKGSGQHRDQLHPDPAFRPTLHRIRHP